MFSRLKFFAPDVLDSFFASVSCVSPPCTDFELSDALAVPLIARRVFEFSSIIPKTVSLILLSTASSSYAAGPDGVSLFSIYKALSRLAFLLASATNVSLSIGDFPSL